MQLKKNRLGVLQEEQKMIYVKKIIGFFHDQRDEEIGVIAAQEVLEFFLALVGDDVYARAIKDVQKITKGKLDDLVLELELLAHDV